MPAPMELWIADGVDAAFHGLSLAQQQRTPALLIAMPGERTHRCWEIAAGWAQAIGASSHDEDLRAVSYIEDLAEVDRQVPHDWVLILSNLHLADDEVRQAAFRLASERITRGGTAILSGRRDSTGSWITESDDLVPSIRRTAEDDDRRFPSPTALVLYNRR